MTILFYYPFNKRTIPIDVPLFELKRRGHTIMLLTISEKGPLHSLYERNGIKSFCHKKKSRIGQIIELIQFCKKHKINVIHSHLQQTNLITVIASLFLPKTRTILFRHHCKFHHLIKNTHLKAPLKEIIADRIINFMAKQIIVPATAVKKAMIKREKANANKIKIIPYIYRFDEMQQVSTDMVESIRAKYSAKLLIAMISRMTPFKRHMIALDAIIPLIHEGKDIQVLIMDIGPEMTTLKEIVSRNNLNGNIHFLGFKKNILEYIAASDMILHPSLTDASNSVIKEAALFEKLVVVCDQVGDFNDYIVHGQNGYLLKAETFSEECQKLIDDTLEGKVPARKIGANLKKAVLSKFSFDGAIIDKYEAL